MIWIGTSGYNYPEWKGSFYPADLPAAKMLPYYAARFPTVEINYTFYRMPTEKLVARVGGPDAVALQADAEGAAADHARQPAEELRRARRRVLPGAGTLGRQAGRPAVSAAAQRLKKDLALFDAFLAELPPKVRAAFEFRHPSWLDDEVFERLARTKSRAVRRRQREAVHAGPRDGRLRVLPAARRRLHRRTTSGAGPRPSRARPRPAATCSSISSTRRKERARVRAAADGAPGSYACVVTAAGASTCGQSRDLGRAARRNRTIRSSAQ